MAFKMKNPSVMKMAKMAGDSRSAMKMKKDPMKMKKDPMKMKDPMDMKKDPMMMKKEPMKMKKEPMKMKKNSAMDMKKGSVMKKIKQDDKSKLRKNLDKALVKRKINRAKALRERAAKLRDKKTDKSKNRANRLETRAKSKETRAGVKEKIAKNVAAGKNKKANLVDSRGKQTPVIKNKTVVRDSAGKKTNKVAPKSDAGVENMTFREAFRSSRNAGKKIFTYKGKKYTTQTRSEKAAKTPKAPTFGGKTKAEFDKMSPEEKAKFTTDNAFKMSPKKMADKTGPARARDERARLKKERENKRKKSTSFTDKTSIEYKKKMAGL